MYSETETAEAESASSETENSAWPRVVHLLHFNDVYNVEEAEREPKAGAARFVTAVKSEKHLNPLILFAGDALNPSFMSTITLGKHMVPVLNAIGVDVSVMGNHDFDFGVDNLMECAADCTFPWLLSNIIDTSTGNLLADAKLWHIVERNGVKIGVLGLVEEEWIDTLSAVDTDLLEVEDFCVAGSRLAKQLREEHGCHVIVGLTHMRWPNDERLAREVPEIDIVLGGHDHDYNVKRVDGKIFMKSGTDFKQYSVIEMVLDGADASPRFDVRAVTVDSSFEPDAEVALMLKEDLDMLEKAHMRVLGQVAVDLDGRFATIRNEESNLGNFITDIMLTAVEADIAMINSGSLRNDSIIPAGDFRVKELNQILPLMDPIMVKELTGTQILACLENSVSKFPAYEGRFLQVSGIKFCFDPAQQPGQRVDASSVFIADELLVEEKSYLVALKGYMAEGRDGYDVLKKCRTVLDDENGPELNTAVQNYFRAFSVIKVLSKSSKCKHHHHAPVISLHRRKTMTKEMLEKENGGESGKSHSKWDLIRMRKKVIDEEEKNCAKLSIAPKLEGRITQVATK